MTQDKGKRERRHPDTVGCPEGLTEGAAAVRPPAVREDGDGFVQYWLEGGEAPSRGTTENGLPLAEGPSSSLPPPECGECGKPFLGRIEVQRRCFHCRSCGKGRFPLDRAPGLEGSAFTPGMAGVMAGTVPVTGFGAAARYVADLAGARRGGAPVWAGEGRGEKRPGTTDVSSRRRDRYPDAEGGGRRSRRQAGRSAA